MKEYRGFWEFMNYDFRYWRKRDYVKCFVICFALAFVGSISGINI